MGIALHKHSEHMNILPNPDEDLRKEFTFRGMAADVASAVPAVEFRE